MTGRHLRDLLQALPADYLDLPVRMCVDGAVATVTTVELNPEHSTDGTPWTITLRQHYAGGILAGPTLVEFTRKPGT